MEQAVETNEPIVPKPLPEPTLEEMERSFSPDQLQALDMILNLKPHSCGFLLGEAGSGKSYLINYLRKALSNTVVTATTGAAAQLINGRTLHSYASICYRRNVAFANKKARERLERCELLIIDEISMASVQLMKALWGRFQLSKVWPRVLLVGDFMQLPPVDDGSKPCTPLYREIHMWGVPIMRLKQQHRQTDLEFMALLNEVRRGGRPSEKLLKFLQEHKQEPLPDGPVHLLSRRDDVSKRNRVCLDKLPGNVQAFEWTLKRPDAQLDDGPDDPDDEPIEEPPPTTRARFHKILYLKKNARVMMLNNTMEWCNGSMGTILDIIHGQILVRLDRTGNTVVVSRAREEIIDRNGNVSHIVVQYPLMLAWALTIHKSQGSTIDNLAVDLDNHFSPGMTYVALSRARRGADLVVAGDIGYIEVDRTAAAYA